MKNYNIKRRQGILDKHNANCIDFHAMHNSLSVLQLKSKEIGNLIAKSSDEKLVRSILRIDGKANKKEHQLLEDALIARGVHMYQHWHPFSKKKMREMKDNAPGTKHLVLTNRRKLREKIAS